MFTVSAALIVFNMVNAPEVLMKKKKKKVVVDRVKHFPTMEQSTSTNGHDGLVVSRKRSATKFTRAHLPIDDVESQIVEVLMRDETSIFLGETGSGKSTQIPKMCIKAGWCVDGQKIAVTQPRRVAAMSLATRVAQEMDTVLGEKVGYRVRFEAMTSDQCSIVYMTDGILLREALHDSLLKDYGGVLVDEAHERSLHTDVLLSVLRVCQRQRRLHSLPPLRIVIMSATIHCQLFSDYFGGASVNVIQGRTHPIELFYAESLDPSSADYVYDAIVTVLQLHRQEPLTDDMLVFLTGREEIEMACKKIKETNKELEHPLHPVQLFAAMTSTNQMKAFEKAPEGHRKVIFSTNISETSLTIPGIRIVIDTGKVKTKTFNTQDRIDVLRVHSISRAQALQRAGRAGREAPGKCYRLYPENHYHQMPENSVPEILRSNLSSVLMEMLEIGVKKIHKLKLIENPPEESIRAAVQQLKAFKAVNEKKNGSLKLTESGMTMLQFPIAPELARVLMAASNYGCIEEALWIVACMASETVFASETRGDADEAERVKRRYQTTEGDHITMLNVCNVFRREKSKNNHRMLKEFCDANFLNLRNLNTVIKVRSQLRELAMKDDKFVMKTGGANRDLVRRSLADGLFMNACVYDRQEDKYRLMVNPGIMLKIHPTSALSRSKPSCFVFTDLVRTTDLYARDITLIDEEWVKERVEEYKKTVGNGTK